MKIEKIRVVVLFLLAFGLQTIQAQDAVTAAGGDASGFGGTVAYSVGQIVYNTNTVANISVAQGVQQPYEISIFPGKEDNSIILELTVFPNPTNNFLILNAGNSELSTLSYQLYDNNGKILKSRKMISSTETIGMENLPSSIYFLKVVNNKKEVKTFKIIKN